MFLFLGNPMNLSEQIFDHHKKINNLKLKLHPDKGGKIGQFVELSNFLQTLDHYRPDWASIVNFVQDVQDIHDGKYSIVIQRRNNFILDTKLTFQMIIDHIHDEYNKTESTLNSFNIDMKYENINIPRYNVNERYATQSFTIQELTKCFENIFYHLSCVKRCCQTSKPFQIGYYYVFETKNNLNECVEKVFPWKTSLVELFGNKSISDWLLSIDDVTEFNYMAKKGIATNLFEAYHFATIPKQEEAEVTQRKRKLPQKNVKQYEKHKKKMQHFFEIDKTNHPVTAAAIEITSKTKFKPTIPNCETLLDPVNTREKSIVDGESVDLRTNMQNNEIQNKCIQPCEEESVILRTEMKDDREEVSTKNETTQVIQCSVQTNKNRRSHRKKKIHVCHFDCPLPIEECQMRVVNETRLNKHSQVFEMCELVREFLKQKPNVWFERTVIINYVCTFLTDKPNANVRARLKDLYQKKTCQIVNMQTKGLIMQKRLGRIQMRFV